MHSRSRLLFMVLLLGVGTLALPWAASAQEPVTSRLKMSIGGYIKPEIMYRTNAAAAGLAGNPFGISNFGFAPIAQKNTTAGANGTLSLNANETRLNFTMTAPDWRGMKPIAFLETDFAGNDGVYAGYCQGANVTPGTIASIAGQGAGPCYNSQNAVGSPQTADFGYGGFRLRHAFFRLSGEGLGGSWSLTAGQTWGIYGMLPYYASPSLSFGGGSIWGQRQPQFSFQHTVKFFRDFSWINTAGVVADTTFMNEMPAFEASSRMQYAGWQGWNGGARTPLHFGISARTQRDKVQQEAPAGLTNGPVRALRATAWGVTGGLFLPILPGTSATDRTWALSVGGEAGWGEGANGWIPNASPFQPANQLGSNNLATPGAVFFDPSSCNFATSSAFAAGSGGVTGVTPVAGATSSAAGGPCGGNAFSSALIPTRVHEVKSTWASWNAQFYLPWNFWLSGGQKYVWFTNGDNAFAQTTFCYPNLPATGCALITPTAQGNWNANSATPWFGCYVGDCVSLNNSRDGQIKRMTYSYIALFYDMTPNIRWGFEYGRHGTNRKNSIQDNQSNRWQFGAYYFF